MNIRYGRLINNSTRAGMIVGIAIARLTRSTISLLDMHGPQWTTIEDRFTAGNN
jgi:hypothetical protein